MMKKIFSILMTVCLMVGLLPISAVAEDVDGEMVIQLGTTAIKDPEAPPNDSDTFYTPASYVYFGNSSTPIKWRVLDNDKNNAGSAGMFLLSEYLLGSNVQFDKDASANTNQTNPNEWQYSDAQKWCSDNLRTYFSTQEQNAMLAVDKTDGEESNLYSLSWNASSLSKDTDKLFFLSVKELADYVGNYDRAPGLKAYTDSTETSAGAWWLRSPAAYNSIVSGGVDDDGVVDYLYVLHDWAARPAFNINLNSVLFTSTAKGGKTAETLAPVKTTDTNEWKLTLLDSSRKFDVTDKTPITAMAGDTIELNYTGAVMGDNEYISVILADADGTLQYYGHIMQPASADGTVSVTIPADLAAGSYTLKVFSEQYNGNYKTDYASAFCDVELTIPQPDLPQTGDDAHIALWLTLMGASCAGMVALAVCGKKRRME